ncbi:MAG TPA: LuxR C-terminal-related transcriptional regulator, partial [Arachidicoccus sp.]|nr:LuxR C-terminal-related transcriptional regulator [Arachidicoccus sp.]
DYALTPREKDILFSLTNGNSYKMIAADLNITTGTVCTHIKHIYEKLQVHSQSEAVSKTLRERLL